MSLEPTSTSSSPSTSVGAPIGATSEHFKNEELRCPHCLVNGARQPLVDALELLRAALSSSAGHDMPITIDSAYRCPIHNAAVGGVPNSEHVQGIAADLRAKGWTAAQLEAAARSIPSIHGIGRDDLRNYIHIDTRNLKTSGTISLWCYDAEGKWCAYYPPSEVPSISDGSQRV